MSATSSTTPTAAIRIGLRVIWDAEPGRYLALLLIATARGLVPAAGALLTGAAVAAAPSAVSGAPPSGMPLAAVIVGLVTLYGLDQVTEKLVFPIEEGWAMRLYGRVQHRTMRALLGPPLLDHLLDQDVQRLADLAGRMIWPNIAPFSTATLRATTWLVGGMARGALVFAWSPPLAIVAAGTWISVGAWVQRRELRALEGGWEAVRRPHYYRWLALQHRSAGELRVFGLGDFLIGRFDEGWKRAMVGVWKQRAATGRRLAGLIGLLVAGNLAFVAVVAQGASSGALSPSRVAVVATALVGLTQLALPQPWTEPWLRGASRLPALRELEEVASRERARVMPASPVPVEERPQRDVRFENVTFSYPGRPAPVLSNLDLRIEAGRSLAIVGLNGAGKTTLVKLLSRLHDPDEGRVTVDGIDLRNVDPVAWQSRVAAIFQDFVRYPLTAQDNITLAGPGDPLDEIAFAAAAGVSGAAQIVDDMPRGWSTVLSRRFTDGLEPSGGQWQRIALARAIYAMRSGAGVLVLDEPTANLDVRGEAEVFDRFLEIARGHTTILISHRFSTVRRADRIVVLHDGRILEDGDHTSLLAAGGRYAELFRLQADRYIAEAEPAP